MPIEFQCPCGKTLRTPDDTAGRQAKCPACGNVLTIPGGAAPPAFPQPSFPQVAPGAVPAGNPFGAAAGAGNPYAAPPMSGMLHAGAVASPRPLASLGARLGGVIIDGLMGAIWVVPGVIVLMPSVMENRDPPALAGILLWAGSMIAFLIGIVNWYLIATSGQTIGKKICGTRIIRMDGSQVDFVRGVIMRAWLPALLSMIPCLGAIFGIVDICFIFREDRRCLHDLIADTQVVVA